jgi:hypothetical protein
VHVQREVDQLRTALTTDATAGGADGYLPIQGMLDTLADEEWFTQIRNWRTSEFGSCESWCWFIDGRSPFAQRSGELPERVCRLVRELPALSMSPASASTGG